MGYLCLNFSAISRPTKSLTYVTLSQCPSWIHPVEFPSKFLTCKTTPCWKRFEFSISPMLVTWFRSPRWKFPGDSLNFTPMSLCITSVVSVRQSLVSVRVPSESYQSVVTFSQKHRVKFHGYYWCSFAFSRRTGNRFWNLLDEGFPAW